MDKYFDNSKVWSHMSEITGKCECFRDNGEMIPDYPWYKPHTIVNNQDRFPTFESFQRYRLEIIHTTNSLIERIKRGEVWEQITPNVPEVITFLIEYPNGKNGDIDMYISDKYGTIERVSQTVFRVQIPSSKKETLSLLNDYYATYANKRMELTEFLKTYNLYYKLREMYQPVGIACLSYNREILQDIISIPGAYFKSIKSARNEIYTNLITSGITTPKWISEYKLFIRIKSIYPDAIFQYRADWLGKQSLDIFIPSLSLGIEYQGIQHYEEVQFFGGEKGLKDRIALDQKKRKICFDRNVKLLEFRYNEVMDIDYIKKKVNDALG